MHIKLPRFRIHHWISLCRVVGLLTHPYCFAVILNNSVALSLLFHLFFDFSLLIISTLSLTCSLLCQLSPHCVREENIHVLDPRWCVPIIRLEPCPHPVKRGIWKESNPYFERDIFCIPSLAQESPTWKERRSIINPFLTLLEPRSLSVFGAENIECYLVLSLVMEKVAKYCGR